MRMLMLEITLGKQIWNLDGQSGNTGEENGTSNMTSESPDVQLSAKSSCRTKGWNSNQERKLSSS